MNREPIFEQLADARATRIRQQHYQAGSFSHDRQALPVFAAALRACGWNGLHLRAPGGSVADDTAALTVVQAGPGAP